MAEAPLLELIDLRVDFQTDDGVVKAVDGVSVAIGVGETLGVVGESGSGKTVMSLAILGLLPKRAKVTGSVLLRGRELLGLPEKALRPIRGDNIAMIFQDALTALNPSFKVGDQIAEAIAAHRALSRED
jgi:ABC-type microcin C transport system duplicated ATPase subunit YejF